MNTPRHTEDDIARTEGLSSAPLTRGVSRVRLLADLTLSVCRLPLVLVLIAGLFVEAALGKARHALADWREHRAEWAAHRATGGTDGGEYPVIDRPLTFGERQARRRRDREQS